MTKYIHIHAKCNYFEIFEQVPEKKSVARLVRIRENYLWAKKHNQIILPKRSKSLSNYSWIISEPKEIDQSNMLSVKTCVVNPELPFINCY